MKQMFVLVALLPALAAAEDFDGTWKVPDRQTQDPAACKRGDWKECLRLAWTTEAGIRRPGSDDLQRLETARGYHAKACEIAKQKPCANAERIGKKIDATKALKSNAERAQFWCVDALEGATRFAAGSKTAPVVVTNACISLFPASFQKSLRAVAGVEGEMKQALLFVAAQESLCPTLKTKPPACTAKNPDKPREPFATILEATLTGDVAVRAGELVTWMTK